MTKVFKYVNDPDLCLFVPQMTIGQEADHYCHRCVHMCRHHFDVHTYATTTVFRTVKGNHWPLVDSFMPQFVFHSGPEQMF